jgi:hypothetical protein
MIDNFDDVKQQLLELATVINSYKSEAVQLRIVELVLGAPAELPGSENEGTTPVIARSVSRRRRKPRSPVTRPNATVPGASGTEKTEKKASPKNSSRPGAKATLSKLYENGFFNKPRTLGDLIAHAETNMALKYKQSDFSGSLARYVRDEKLKRVKNADNQYEYTKS